MVRTSFSWQYSRLNSLNIFLLSIAKLRSNEMKSGDKLFGQTDMMYITFFRFAQFGRMARGNEKKLFSTWCFVRPVMIQANV